MTVGSSPRWTSVDRRAIPNTLAQLAQPVIRIIFGLGLAAVLTRHLGVGGFGAYAVVFAYIAIFSGIFNDWGLGTIALREMSRRPGEQVAITAAAASLQALVSIGTYAIVIASLFLVSYPTVIKEGIALYGLTLLSAPIDILALPFQADLRMMRLVPASILGSGLNFALTMLAVLADGPLPAIVAAAVVALAVQYAWVLRMSIRKLALPIKPSRQSWAYLLSEAWPLTLGTVVSSVLQQGPLLALSVWSVGGAGLFSAANRVPQQLLLVPLAVRATAFPLLSERWERDRDAFACLLRRLVDGSLLVGIPVALVGIGLSGPAMTGLFSAKFATAAPACAILMVVFAILFPGILVGEALIAAGYQRINLVILGASLPLVVALLRVLVPVWGPAGAALAVLATYGVIVIADVLVSRFYLGPVLCANMFIAPAFAAAFGAAILLQAGRLGSIQSSLLAGIVAFVVLAAAKPDVTGTLWRMAVDHTRHVFSPIGEQQTRGQLSSDAERFKELGEGTTL